MAILFASTMSFHAQNKIALHGKVIDKQSGDPLIGASVYFPDLKIGTRTDVAGIYKINNLPKATLLVKVAYIGYQQIVQLINLATTNSLDFSMNESVAEFGEVVVTGLSNATESNRTSSPISVVTPTKLKQSSATNIIDAISAQPGISQITTGPGISKPVIRGLGYNRVVVVNDGIRQEGQQWGDEHGIEKDEYSVNSVEILKGPASLAYGSDAMAGAINLLPEPTLPEGSIKGNILANYQTNNGLIGGSLNIGGNQNGFVWDIRYSNKLAHAYQNKYDGYVFNSGFKQNNLEAMLGLNKSWGYSHLIFSIYNLVPGIIEGERDHITGHFIKSIAINDTTTDKVAASNSDYLSYTPLVPYQRIHHYKIVANNNFYLGNGSVETTLGWQENQRQEYGKVIIPNEYGLYFYLNTLNYEAHYNYPINNNIDLSFGTNGMYQNSQNKGNEFMIPDYNLFDSGFFALAKKSWEKWTLSCGVRYDLRNENGKSLWLDTNGKKSENPDITSKQQFFAFHSKYQGISGSIGTTYQINDILYTKLNFSKGFRAPNIAEISANGKHEGTVQYLIGSPYLKSEDSYQIDYAFGINSEHAALELDLFYNQISNYIFLEKLQSTFGADSLTNGYQTFKYSQGNASLFGGEITLDIHPHPLDWLHFENSFSYVQSTLSNHPDSMRYLPLTPAPKLYSEIKAYNKNIGEYFSNSYVSIGVEYYFKQNHFFQAFGTETATSSYTLLNVGIGTDIISKNKTLFSIYISANNLTNVAYQSHLSRLKYLDENSATGRKGVYNMGQNFSFKLIVPIDINR